MFRLFQHLRNRERKNRKKRQKQKSKKREANHERVPRHGREKTIEQFGGAELVDDPIIAIAVDNGLVEVEHHDDPSH